MQQPCKGHTHTTWARTLAAGLPPRHCSPAWSWTRLQQPCTILWLKRISPSQAYILVLQASLPAHCLMLGV